jgi:hypothetical protein
MDGFESTRRDFMRKLGLTLGASLVAGAADIKASVIEKKEEFTLSPEQHKFMEGYETWMDEFILVIRRQTTHPMDIDNNRKIVVLSEKAKGWQKQLVDFMKDENFARYYMTASERMTKEIPF